MVSSKIGLLAAPLLASELRFRGASVRLVITDVDGVLTDSGVFYSERGESMMRFSRRDGMAVQLLREEGIETAFLTREASPIAARRAEKLGIRWLYQGVTDKKGALDGILADAGVDRTQIAYIGDDVNDLEVMTEVSLRGLTGAPLDAVPAVLRAAQHHCARPGGCGAFRDFAEWILELRELARMPRAAEIPFVDLPWVGKEGVTR